MHFGGDAGVVGVVDLNLNGMRLGIKSGNPGWKATRAVTYIVECQWCSRFR